MVRKFIISSLLLFICGLFSIEASTNPIPSSSKQNKNIVLYDIISDDSIELSWKNIVEEDFTSVTGFFLNDVFSFYREINGANDTTYVNFQMGNTVQVEHFHPDDENYYSYSLRRVNFSSPAWKKYIQCKIYNKDNHKWSISDRRTDKDWILGNSYSIDKLLFHDVSDEEDSTFIAIIIFFLIYLALAVILPFWDNDNYGCVWWLVGFLFSLGCAIFIESNMQKQLFLLLLSIISTSILFKIPRYVGKVRYVSQILIGIVIISIFTYRQFFIIDETFKFEDGQELNIKWKRGTCLIKRYYIKQMLSNMIPVKVKSKGKEYVLYVSKYEFSEDDSSVVTGKPFNWFNVLFKFNRPLENFSFRESQIMQELLSKITGVEFDFLSYEEWCAASLYKNHSPNSYDFVNVDEGVPNENGLVNIIGNMPEYTSNYYASNYKLGLAADTLIRSYNNVFVAGSAYECTDSINTSIVNKNISEGYVGFRLVYRPNDIGARRFCIIGNLRSDRKHTDLPQQIKLISIDGHSIDRISNYESFEELLIECRFKNKTIRAIDLQNNKEFSFQHPKGFEYYDFEPQFSFVGL